MNKIIGKGRGELKAINTIEDYTFIVKNDFKEAIQKFQYKIDILHSKKEQMNFSDEEVINIIEALKFHTTKVLRSAINRRLRTYLKANPRSKSKVIELHKKYCDKANTQYEYVKKAHNYYNEYESMFREWGIVETERVRKTTKARNDKKPMKYYRSKRNYIDDTNIEDIELSKINPDKQEKINKEVDILKKQSNIFFSIVLGFLMIVIITLFLIVFNLIWRL